VLIEAFGGGAPSEPIPGSKMPDMNFRLSLQPVLCALPFAVSACTAHFAGQVRINGAPFEPTACRSGQAHGFAGIELIDNPGQRIRIAENLDGTPAVVYFPPGTQVGTNLGTCGGVHAVFGTGVINGVHNLEGTATLLCSATTPRVEGTLQFKNCH